MTVSIDHEFLDLLKSLIRQPAVVGSEHSFFRVIQRELEERGASVSIYQGVLVAQGNDPESAQFSAHVDRHGLVCTGPNEFQFAAFVAANRSDLLGNSVSEKMASKVAERYVGLPVIAYEPWAGTYRGTGTITKAEYCTVRNNLTFEVKDIGYLMAGLPLAFSDRLIMKDGYISAQLDNVLTVAHLIHLYSQGFQGTAFFTAEEEIGSSWRFLLEWFRRFREKTNRLIVVDTSPYPDQETAEKQSVVLRHCDANAEFDQDTTLEIENLCRKNNISYSFKDLYIEEINREALAEGREPGSLGSTELGRIIAASEGFIQGTTLQVPTTGYHTVEETCTIESSLQFGRLLRLIAGIE